MKILRGTLFGGIAYFLLGWLIYGIMLMDFFSANMDQSGNRPEGTMIWWAMILSNLLTALLLTLILDWSRTITAGGGFSKGAIFGLLISSGIAFSFWSMTTMYNTFGLIFIDILVSTIIFGFVGLIIVLTWGKEKPV